MKIRNPNFKSAEELLIEQWAAAMETYLKGAAASKEFITIDDLKAQFPAQAAMITEGRVEAVCRRLGLQVER